MENTNMLPFPEPNEEEIAEFAAAFMYKNQERPDYTEDLAKRDATSFLVFRNAMSSRFLHETGLVTLPSGSAFKMRRPAPADME